MTPKQWQHACNSANAGVAEKHAHEQDIRKEIQSLKEELLRLQQALKAAVRESEEQLLFANALREAALESGVDPDLLQVL